MSQSMVLGQDLITIPVHTAEQVPYLCAEGDRTKSDTVLALVWQIQAEREEGRPKWVKKDPMKGLPRA